MSCVFCQESVLSRERGICLARTACLAMRSSSSGPSTVLCDRTCNVVDTTDKLSTRGPSHSFLPQTVFDSAPIDTARNQIQCGSLEYPDAVLGENQSDCVPDQTSVTPPTREGLPRKRTVKRNTSKQVARQRPLPVAANSMSRQRNAVPTW